MQLVMPRPGQQSPCLPPGCRAAVLQLTVECVPAGGGAAAQPARPAQAPQPPAMTTVTLGTDPLGTGAASMQLQQQPGSAGAHSPASVTAWGPPACHSMLHQTWSLLDVQPDLPEHLELRTAVT